MYETQNQIFLYHGYGLGCGGYVERKGERFAIETVAAGALSITGGYSETRQRGWKYPNASSQPGSRGSKPPTGLVVSIDETTTRVWSDWKQDEERKDEGVWVTTAEVRTSGFNLDNVVKADLLVAKLTSVHYKQRKGVRKQQPRISFSGSEIRNLTIRGVPVTVPIDAILDDFQTHDELKDALNGNTMPKPRKDFPAAQCKAWSRDLPVRNLRKGKKSDPEYVSDIGAKFLSKTVTRCSIAGPLTAPPETTGYGYSINIEGYGRIFVGEMIVSDSMKHLSMLRVDLGCDSCAALTAAAAIVNGESMP